MITGDNDTGNIFIAGINDTGEQLSPVTTTPAITFFPGVIDTGQMSMASVNGTADKVHPTKIIKYEKNFYLKNVLMYWGCCWHRW